MVADKGSKECYRRNQPRQRLGRIIPTPPLPRTFHIRRHSAYVLTNICFREHSGRRALNAEQNAVTF